MSWYKTSKTKISKIIDLSDNPSVSSHPIVCPSCMKWATEDNSRNTIWKYYYEMDPEEKAHIDRTKDLANLGGAKHKLEKCEDCQKLETYHPNKNH